MKLLKEDLLDKAKEEFGTTNNWRKAAYINTDGTLLDFSEGSDRRIDDHRSISWIFDTSIDGSDAMIEYMKEGNIRFLPEGPGFDILKEPNEKQYQTIKNLCYNFNDLYIDFTNEKGYTVDNIEYNRVNPNKILNDIKEYFKTGKAPQQSITQQFRESKSLNETKYIDLNLSVDEIDKYINNNYKKTKDISSLKSTSHLINREGYFIDLDKNTHLQILKDLVNNNIITQKDSDLDRINLINTDLFAKLGYIRCNSDIHEYTYIQLPKEKITSAQYETLRDWLDNLASKSEIVEDDIHISTEVDVVNGPAKYYSYVPNVDYIINRIKRYYSSGNLYEDVNKNNINIEEILIDNFVNSKDVIQRSWLSPNGIFISNINYNEEYEYVGEPNHSTVLEWLANNGYIKEDSYTELEKLGFIRLSNWDSAIILTDVKPTSSQYYQMEEWLEDMQTNGADRIFVDVPSGESKWFYFEDYSSRDIVNRIKRYYASGNLYEDISKGYKTRKDLKDLTGKKFGELTVLEYDKERSRTSGQTYWKCKCSCGKECSVARKHLLDGSIKSCGHGKIQSGLDHYEKNFKGMRDRQNKYNTNLEIIRNQKMQPNNTSGVKGVDYHKGRDEWRARVHVGGKEITKWFKDKEDAIKWREQAVDKYYKPKIDQAIKAGDLKETLELSNEYDNEGNQLTKAQAEFFKNSKVRDEKGRLLVCYHGTDKEFDTFDKNKIKTGTWGNGFYFTTQKYSGDSYGKYNKKYYLNIENCIEIPAEYEDITEFVADKYYNDRYNDIVKIDNLKATDIIKEEKYDGICIPMYNNWGDFDYYVAFESNQIKAITNKNPTNSDNINESIIYRGSGVNGLSIPRYLSKYTGTFFSPSETYASMYGDVSEYDLDDGTKIYKAHKSNSAVSELDLGSFDSKLLKEFTTRYLKENINNEDSSFFEFSEYESYPYFDCLDQWYGLYEDYFGEDYDYDPELESFSEWCNQIVLRDYLESKGYEGIYYSEEDGEEQYQIWNNKFIHDINEELSKPSKENVKSSLENKLINKLKSQGYKYEYKSIGWYDEKDKPIDMIKYVEENGNMNIPAEYFYREHNSHIFTGNNIEFIWDIDEKEKEFIIIDIWSYKGAKKGEASQMLYSCLEEIPDNWTITIKDNLNRDYWYHMQDKFPNYNWVNESLKKKTIINLKEDIKKENYINETPDKQPEIIYMPFGRTKIEIIKNPTRKMLADLDKEQRELHPWLEPYEPAVRFTYGENGNEYIWPAYDAMHDDVERYIYKTFKERTNQNKSFDTFNINHSDLLEDYLDDNQEFYDYGTGTVLNADIFDTTKASNPWQQDILNDPKEIEEREGIVSEIVNLSPKEYLTATGRIFNHSVEEEYRQMKLDKGVIEHLKKVILDYKRKFPITYLFEEDNKQEGRHRMYVAGLLFGFDHDFPVQVLTYNERGKKLKLRDDIYYSFKKTFEKITKLDREWFTSYNEFIERIEEDFNYDLLKLDIDEKVKIYETEDYIVANVKDVTFEMDKNQINISDDDEEYTLNLLNSDKIYQDYIDSLSAEEMEGILKDIENGKSATEISKKLDGKIK